MSPPIRRKNRAPHILIIVVVVSLLLSSRHPGILVVVSSFFSFYRAVYPRCPICCCCIVSSSSSYRHRAPRGPSSEASCTSRHRAPQRSHPFAYGCVIQVASICKRESAGYFPWVKNHLQTGGSHYLQTGGVCKRGVTCHYIFIGICPS